jgi:hypothetical protein
MSFKISDFNERTQARIREQIERDTVGTRLPNAEQCERSQALASDRERKAQSARLPVVRFTLRRKKLLDVDAKYASTKDLLDGLQYAGLIRGDKEGQIILEVHQEKVNPGEPEKTIIEVSDL